MRDFRVVRYDRTHSRSASKKLSNSVPIVREPLVDTEDPMMAMGQASMEFGNASLNLGVAVRRRMIA